MSDDRHKDDKNRNAYCIKGFRIRQRDWDKFKTCYKLDSVEPFCALPNTCIMYYRKKGVDK